MEGVSANIPHLETLDLGRASIISGPIRIAIISGDPTRDVKEYIRLYDGIARKVHLVRFPQRSWLHTSIRLLTGTPSVLKCKIFECLKFVLKYKTF